MAIRREYIGSGKKFIRYSPEEMADARQTDMLDFLSRKEGFTFIRVGSVYQCNEHDSLIIQGDRQRWYWNSQKLKGLNCIDWLMKIDGMGVQEAFETIIDLSGNIKTEFVKAPEIKNEPKEFHLPPKSETYRNAAAYLTKTRMIDSHIVSYCIKNSYIYQDQYKNVVFVGFDSDGIPRHAHKRGTCQKGQPFKGNVEGCDPRYSFRWVGKSNTVYVFEAPIDMLSFISMYQKGWMDHSYVALCGVAEHALMQLLNDAPHISQIALCLDHDKAGIQARERIKKNLSERGYHMVFSLFSNLKDWNEDLQELKKPPPEYMNRQQTVIQMM